jgi:hypothetical protein
MRYMLILKGEPELGAIPSTELIDSMTRFNEQMVKAGVLLAGEGLTHSTDGTRVVVTGDGKRTVTDGPFTETKELVAGFWLLQVSSREEALEWATRAPVENAFMDGQGATIEVRRVVEMAADFPTMTDEQVAKEESLRQEITNYSS